MTELVMVAEHGTVGQLEGMVRGLRTVEHTNSDPDERDSGSTVPTDANSCSNFDLK